MKKLILILIVIYSKNLFAQDKIYLCEGLRYFTVSSESKNKNIRDLERLLSDKDVEDSISLILRGNKVILTGGDERSPTHAMIYDKKVENMKISSEFLVCKNENYEIYFNNYNCDKKNILPVFKEIGYDTLEGKFNGVTHQLSLESKSPKSSYGAGKYKCKISSSSY